MISLLAPAKVNLYLHVGPPNGNGRHPLDSLVVFAAAEAADRLTIEPSETLQLAVIGPQAEACGPVGDNLVFRAAHALKEILKTSDGARLTLVKHLPVAAGIGGGSADAGAALRGLNAHWGGPDVPDHLVALAAHLGGDVPACTISRPVLMRGEGERLQGVTLPAPLPTLLVNPGIPCPTGPIFKAYDAAGGGHDFREIDVPVFDTNDQLIDWLSAETFNDLEAPALIHHPEIAGVLETLRALPGVRLARMSGSGATCFALFNSQDAADAAAHQARNRHPDWWVIATAFGDGR